MHAATYMEAVYGAVFHTEGSYSAARPILVHDKVHSKVLNCTEYKANQVILISGMANQGN